MRIAGFEKSSVVDYPGMIAAVVFVHGCNFNCWYCHNRILLQKDHPQTSCDADDIFPFLQKRRGLLGGVVISGGEPMLQKDLPVFIEKVHEMGYKIKLDTNGSRPDTLLALLDTGVVDYVAMDVKAPLNKYPETAGVLLDTKKIVKSIEALKNSAVAHEFRTTFVPTLSPDDIFKIAHLIEGAPLYALQQYRKPSLTKTSPIALGLPAHPPAVFEEAVRLASPHVQKCIVRGVRL
jgi:pyruvate formate lyase activating enzyme